MELALCHLCLDCVAVEGARFSHLRFLLCLCVPIEILAMFFVSWLFVVFTTAVSSIFGDR